MSFRLKLASLPADAAMYRTLQFTPVGHGEHGAMTRSVDPVRGRMLGTHVEYGALFAYLVRRFGLPNGRCGVSRLARYVLATPRPDMFLIVEPTIEGSTDEVFTFIAPGEVVASCERHGLRRAARPAEKSVASAARPLQLRRWADEDPLKPYALAAVRALRALCCPVSLEEDGAIDVFGAVPRTARALGPARAGWHDGCAITGV